MPKITRWTAAVAAACSVLLAACGGGRSQEKGTCTHTAVPATGPGDVDDYFPVDVGRTWTYQTCCSGPGTLTVTVGAPTTILGEPASVFTSSWIIHPYSGGTESGTGSDAYAVRPAGVLLVSSTDAISPLDQALPQLVLPFPVQVTEPMQLVTCQHLRFTEQGVLVDVDMTETLHFAGIQPAFTTGAGTFSDVAQVFRIVRLTLRADGTTTTGEFGVTDYYAPGVGLIHDEVTFMIGGSMWTEGIDLVSSAPSPTVAAQAVQARAPAPADDSLEDLPLRVARRLARIHR